MPHNALLLSGMKPQPAKVPKRTKTPTVKNVSILRDPNAPANRAGRDSEGLYPEVSRTKLAELTNRHISTITGYLKGRTRMPLATATIVAKAIGVSIDQLNEDLKKAQVEFANERLNKLTE